MDAYVITRKILALLRMEKKDLCTVLLLVLSFFHPRDGNVPIEGSLPAAAEHSQTKAKTDGAARLGSIRHRISL
jgi:hypothetical protein